MLTIAEDARAYFMLHTGNSWNYVGDEPAERRMALLVQPTQFTFVVIYGQEIYTMETGYKIIWNSK